ncbi:hypothetical protein RB195_003388 [Necator americanus]|uniref:Uncharacterized protein n=1 Tax=Necator americanus TaxID=51031 RepID=A0ABR1DP46_NECAM
MSLKSVFRKKNRNYDSDSTGYWSSSDVSSPLSGSQFILRPATVQSTFNTKQSFYHTLEDEHYPMSSRYASPSSSSLSTSEHDCVEEDDESTLRPQSVSTIRSLKTTTTLKITACKTAFSSLAIRTRKPRPSLIDLSRSEAPQNTEDFLNFDEGSSMKDQNDVSIDDLFNAIKLQEDHISTEESISAAIATMPRKQIVIKEPDDSSKIYFDYRSKKRLPLPFRTCNSTPPRPILKKEPSLSFIHLYEEIDGDHLSPLPDDVRPKIPNRPLVQPMRLFPPCNEFQPRKINRCRTNSIRKRQKMPSFHHKEPEPVTSSWSCRLRKKLFSKISSDVLRI